MFLHIGQDTLIRLGHVIGIFDYNMRGRTVATREFLQLAESERRLVPSPAGEVKTFIVTPERVYLSPISAATLRRRAEAVGEALAEIAAARPPRPAPRAPRAARSPRGRR